MTLGSIHAGIVREIGRPGGRILGVCEYGDPNGFPVLAFHGIPGTRLMFRPADAAARRLGLRIIAPDRPGFGRSTPQRNRDLHDWVGDVDAVLTAYDIDRFSLIGVSGGSPFATLTAAHFGARVAGMILIGPMGPVADLGGDARLNMFHQLMFKRLPKIPGGYRCVLAPANTLFRLSPSVQYRIFLRLLPASDRAIMTNPTLKAGIIEDVRESLKQGGDGMRTDLLIFSRPWNVTYVAIKAQAVLWQGLADTIVPVHAAIGLGKLIPGCRIVEIPQAGHFWVYDNIDLVLEELAKLSNLG